MKIKKKGFTLAEVLITLGIIGVVAAITLPPLKLEIDATIYKNRFKKHIAEIQKVFLLMKANDEYLNVYSYTNQNDFINNFNSKFKGNVRICNDIDNANSECGNKNLWIRDFNSLPTQAVYYHYATSISGLNNINRILFPDGTLLAIVPYTTRSGSKETHMVLDINGWKNGPNMIGYDIFHLIIDETGNVAAPYSPIHTISSNAASATWYKNCNGYADSYGCTYKAMTENYYFKNVLKKVKLY